MFAYLRTVFTVNMKIENSNIKDAHVGSTSQPGTVPLRLTKKFSKPIKKIPPEQRRKKIVAVLFLNRCRANEVRELALGIKRKKVGTNKGEKALDKISKAQIKI